MNVEHLWFSSKPLQHPEPDTSRLSDHLDAVGAADSTEEDMVQTLTVMADKRLYKLVKWCKSLPLFKNILVSPTIRPLTMFTIMCALVNFRLTTKSRC
jgi:hypothetical protein